MSTRHILVRPRNEQALADLAVPRLLKQLTTRKCENNHRRRYSIAVIHHHNTHTHAELSLLRSSCNVSGADNSRNNSSSNSSCGNGSSSSRNSSRSSSCVIVVVVAEVVADVLSVVEETVGISTHRCVFHHQ